MYNEIALYKTKEGAVQLEVTVDKETVRLTQKQMAQLFGVHVPAISKHIEHILDEGELASQGTISKMEIVQTEGKRSVKRSVEHYNLDMIIAVGYRINSKQGTHFRMWATNILRDHLLKGFTINQKRIQEEKLKELEDTLHILKHTLSHTNINPDEAKGILSIITDYGSVWITLLRYDENKLNELTPHPKKSVTHLTYEECTQAIHALKTDLKKKREASDLFGHERSKMLHGIIGNIHQSFDQADVYPTIEEKAAHLLYFLIKDHPFSDGNKRIGAFLFILFLAKNNYLLTITGEKKINDNALVAIALLVAESPPQQKNVMIKLIMSLITNK